MNGYEYALESDELYESDESDEGYDESDEALSFRGRKIPTIKPGPVAKGKVFRPRPVSANKYVTEARFEAALARIGKDIAANSEAIKKVATQANKINSELGAATTKLSKQVSDLKKEVKKQSETSLMLTLLQGTPQLDKTMTQVSGTNVVTDVKVKRQDVALPLLLMGSSGGLGDNMLPLVLLLSDR